MKKRENLSNFWKVVLAQDEEKIAIYFKENASIYWYNTNEKFTVNEFIQANCRYPGEWEGSIERFVEKENLVITVVKVKQKNADCTFHVTSFFEFKGSKIERVDEYWGVDGSAPKWRLDLEIGSKIID